MDYLKVIEDAKRFAGKARNQGGFSEYENRLLDYILCLLNQDYQAKQLEVQKQLLESSLKLPEHHQ